MVKRPLNLGNVNQDGPRNSDPPYASKGSSEAEVV